LAVSELSAADVGVVLSGLFRQRPEQNNNKQQSRAGDTA
jgi:hypothetical protein